ncbi:MAG: PDGLE domain-containing protein [Dehalococcoidia bacterium]|nr:PDGLE domain-containing protein [Dehalococcoidia bacterium]
MGRNRSLILIGAAIAVVVAVSSAWLASGDPDGLERVAEDHEFTDTAKDPGYEILPDYTIPGVENERLSTALAGIVGVAVVGALSLGAGMLLRRRSAGAQSDTPPGTRRG